MGPHVLFVFIKISLCFFPSCASEYKITSGYYQWNTEYLSHVHEHTVFKINLYLLNVFNKKTECEYSG